MSVYAEEYGRTGFQDGLNGYRGAPVARQEQSTALAALLLEVLKKETR